MQIETSLAAGPCTESVRWNCSIACIGAWSCQLLRGAFRPLRYKSGRPQRPVDKGSRDDRHVAAATPAAGTGEGQSPRDNSSPADLTRPSAGEHPYFVHSVEGQF